MDGEKEGRAEVVTEGGWMGRGGEGRAEKVKEGEGEGMLGWVQYTGGGGEERERYRGGSLSRFHA